MSNKNVENSLQHQLVHIVHCGCPLFEFAKCVNKSHSTNLRTQFCKACQQITLHQLADTIATICGKPTLATTVRRMLRTRCDTRATHVRPPCGTHWCHFQFFDHWAQRNTLSFDCCKKKPCPKQNRSHANFLWISSPAHLWFSWADPWSYTLVVACFQLINEHGCATRATHVRHRCDARAT